jgi:predicted acylesterase/phospholipase RssA
MPVVPPTYGYEKAGHPEVKIGPAGAGAWLKPEDCQLRAPIIIQELHMPFDIGLVMAGAVSAGAYTAGAIDFLLQALDAWYAEKGADPDCPNHDVNLKVMTGASAGAFISAMLAVVLNEEFPPITDYPHPPPPKNESDPNKLFDAWVNLIDIDGLTKHQDLDDDPGPVKAFLDSTVLDRIADRVFKPGTARAARRPYVAEPVLLTVTLTNLRGVPYEIDFVGRAASPMPYIMTVHADIMTFAVPAPGSTANTADAVPLNGPVGSGNWPKLRDAALASGAFPGGLVPRALERPPDDYRTRKWYFPHPREVNGKHECGFVDTLKPAFGILPDDFNYNFLNVDGGTMDNEPIGRARELLDPDDPAGINKSHAGAQSAILMIDPFPDNGAFDQKDDFHKSYTLLRMAPRILKALINQARFKPGELTRAIDPNVFNQFLIAPIRSGGHAAFLYPIASGGLGGFGGFLSRDFRAHDFQLGRRNIQQFLRRHFVLPESNALFETWTPAAKDKFRVKRDKQNRTIDPDTGKVKDSQGNVVDPEQPVTTYLPIVPLVGAMTKPEASPIWPSYARVRIETLRQQITDRAKVVVERLISTMSGMGAKFLLRRAWWLKRDDLIENNLMKPVIADLEQRGLMIK